jgi:hypothetical protein
LRFDFFGNGQEQEQEETGGYRYSHLGDPSEDLAEFEG